MPLLCVVEGSEILDQMLQCLEHLPKPMPQLEVSTVPRHTLYVLCALFQPARALSPGLPGHGGSVAHVSSRRGFPNPRQPRGHAGAASHGR